MIIFLYVLSQPYLGSKYLLMVNRHSLNIQSLNLCVCFCSMIMHTFMWVPKEARRDCQIPQSWEFQTTKSTLNHQGNFPGPGNLECKILCVYISITYYILKTETEDALSDTLFQSRQLPDILKYNRILAYVYLCRN